MLTFRIIIIAGCALAFCTTIFSQNLVPNPDFETFIQCPAGYHPGFGSLPCEPWIAPTNGSSDYFNSCNMGVVGVPNNAFGTQPAHSGVAYAGGLYYYAGISNYREYIQVQLTEPLMAGQSYIVSLYYSLGELTCSIDKLGVYLSETQITAPGNTLPLNVQPQLELMLPVDNVEWRYFSGCFIAVGGEEWITIGNFYSDTEITVGTGCPLWGGMIASYVFIDDVLVEESPPPGPLDFTLGGDTIACDSALIEVPVQDANYTWQDGTHYQTYVVTMTGVYHVTVSQECSVGFDTIHVTVIQSPDEVSLGPDTTLCPSEVLLFQLDSALGDFIWQDGSMNPFFMVTAPGQYSVTLTNVCGTGMDSIEVSEAIAPVASFDFVLEESTVIFMNLSQHGLSAQWDFGDGSVSSDWNPSHQYQISGTYVVQLIAIGHCSQDTISQQISVTGTATGDLSPHLAVRIYPNPSDGTFTIFSNDSTPVELVQIFDLVGRQVAFFGLNANCFQTLDSVPGVYVLVFRQGSVMQISRVILQ